MLPLVMNVALSMICFRGQYKWLVLNNAALLKSIDNGAVETVKIARFYYSLHIFASKVDGLQPKKFRIDKPNATHLF